MKLSSFPLGKAYRTARIERLDFYTRYSSDVDSYLVNEIYDKEVYFFQCEHEHPLILDIGANIGLSTIYFKALYPECRIVAFEPDPVSFEILNKNIALHRLSSVISLEKAVSGRNGVADLFVFSEQGSDVGMPVCSLYENSLTKKKIKVESVDISGISCLDQGVDFVKIDIEGGESDVIYSLVESGKIKSIKEIVVEYHHWVEQRYAFDEFIAVLESNGFHMKVICEEDIHPDYPDISGNTILKFIRN
jgi:FkbM family methyltransferase